MVWAFIEFELMNNNTNGKRFNYPNNKTKTNEMDKKMSKGSTESTKAGKRLCSLYSNS